MWPVVSQILSADDAAVATDVDVEADVDAVQVWTNLNIQICWSKLSDW